MQRYKGKVAVVTGGGSGLGDAFCHRLATEGAKVAVLDTSEDGGSRVAEDIKNTGGDACFIQADVTDAGAMEAAVAKTVETYGRLDVAVNNAGIGGGIHPLTEYPVGVWIQTIMVNLVGVFISMRAEIPAMLKTGGGAIVNISSVVAAVAHPNTSAYIAAKHGVVGLTKSASLESAPKNIRINAVGSTWVKTPLTLSAWSGDEAWKALDAQHPLGSCATPEDIAAVVAFLGSGEAAIVTGALYLADGGYSVP